jgi:hypothetical protein
MYFFAASEATSQYILNKVGQEVASEDAEKDAKRKVLEYWNRFIRLFYHEGLCICKEKGRGLICNIYIGIFQK